MHLHYNLRRAKAKKVHDQGSGSAAEFYWTWQVRSEGTDEDLLHQGFSMGCPLDDGYSFKAGESWEINDKFTVLLPPASDGEMRHVGVNVYCFEADSRKDTLAIKKLFTNDATSKLLDFYRNSSERKRKTRKEFLEWLLKEDNALLATVAAAAPGIAPYVKIARAAVPLIGWALEELRNQDDYLGQSRFDLFYGRSNQSNEYRWMFDEGVETWCHEEQTPVFHEYTFVEADRTNIIHTKGIYQILFDPDAPLL